MKTELKTAEQHLDQAWKETDGDLHESAIKAIESHTSERLDHLRQQLEAKRESCEQDELIGLTSAISLIDQLKAETKNT